MTEYQIVPSVLESLDHRVILEDWPDSVRVKVIVGGSSLYVHVNPDSLRAALDKAAPAGSYTRTTSPDLMDGGVTSALVEEEAEQAEILRRDEEIERLRGWIDRAERFEARAEKAEKERDALREENTKGREHGTEVRTAAGLTYLATVEELADTVRNLRLRAAQPRPLTPDDITDEMRDRARKALRGHGIFGSLVPKIVDGVLTAALTEPTRPEGAEAVRSVLGALRDGDGEWMTYASDEDLDGLADAMAERGVRVTPVGLTPTNPEKEQA